MNKQLSALSDADLAALDMGDDLTPELPTPETIDYDAALARLRALKSTVFTSADYGDLSVTADGADILLEQDAQFIWLSSEMLQQAAKWVEGAQ